MQKDQSLPELRWSTLKDFFAAVKTSPAFSSLPVVHSELQHHSRGCYSAYGEGKFQNRRAERWLVESESITLFANLTADHPYPADEFVEAWWKVLFCQFHDMMAGTSLYRDYQDVRDSLGSACETAQSRRVEALETMAQQVDTSKVKESALFLFNPLPWTRKALVEVYAERNPEGAGLLTHLADENGTSFPIQWRPSESMTQFLPRLTAWVELPPAGYKVFELGRGNVPSGAAFSSTFTASENGFGVSSFKAEDGVELLTGSIGLVVVSDTADTWAHDVKQFRQEMGRPALLSASVVEDGPVVRVTRHRARWMESDITLDMVQYAGIDALELRFVIDWPQHQQMLKLEIPTALMQPRIFVKVPGEVLERTTNGEEEPYQDWAAVQGRIGGQDYTLALLNAQTYSYDCLNGLFRTVLIRSAPFARHQPSQVTYEDTNAWQDQGRQERRFWLVGGVGPFTKFNLDRLAEEVQTPAEYVVDSAHAGKKHWQQSFLEVLPGNVWVMAVKRAESSAKAGTIIRIQERAGNPTQAMLKSAALGLDHTVPLKPWELKTLLVKASTGGRAELTEVSLLET